MIVGTLVFVLTFKAGVWLFTPDEETGHYDVQGSFGELRPPEVVLITRGIQPREALRLAPEDGATRRYAMTSRDQIRATAVTETLSATELESVLEVRGRIRQVAPDGSFDWRWKVTDVEVVTSSSTGQLANPEQRRLVEGLAGLRGSSRLDARGFVLWSTLDGGGGGSNRELRQGVARALGEPTVHLPDEPVGERAIWEVHRREVRQGIEMEVTERYELMERRGDRLRLTVRLRATAAPQEVDALFGDLLRTELTAYRAEGGGEWTFDLDGGLDVRGEGWRDEDLSMEQSFQGLPIVVGMETRSEALLDPAR